MANITYYDTTCSTNSSIEPTDTTDSGSTKIIYYSDTYSDTQTPRRILVKGPKEWDEETALEYVDLVNEKTNTGWRVTMLIYGDVIITDPNIETRTMKDFIPLLKYRANPADRHKIDKFFSRNPA